MAFSETPVMRTVARMEFPSTRAASTAILFARIIWFILVSFDLTIYSKFVIRFVKEKNLTNHIFAIL